VQYKKEELVQEIDQPLTTKEKAMNELSYYNPRVSYVLN